MSDGSKLRQSWYSALNEAENDFRQLLTSPPVEWKRLSDNSTAKQKGKTRASLVPELSDVAMHRKSSKSGEDVYRMVLEVPTGEEQVSLEPWRSVLTTPELRKEWDPAVEDAHLVELFDRNTRIAKTNYTLGWPANPRDSVTISRAFYDSTTLLDITTSLPRSPDEPAYLRPSPPFVRSHVQLFAWCIQYIQPPPDKSNIGARLRTTCFWQHDLKALWGFGPSTAALTQQLTTMMLSLLKTVIKRGGRVPKLAGYGNGISIERVRYQIDREALTIDYSIIPNDEEHNLHQELGLQGMDEVHALREYRRLTRSIECILPSLEGWDVQVTMKGSSEEVEKIPWSAHATRTSSNSSTFSPPDQVLLRFTHGALTDDDAVLKVKVVIEVSGGTRGLRLNGLATRIHDLEERDPSSYVIPQKVLQDVASAVDLSIQTSSSLGTVSSTSSSSGLPMIRAPARTPAAAKAILSKVKRNYIYFSSLLQEPEAKWRRTTEARGVSITQLDSIDPTLVVYRAEATFVGVGLWDLFGAVVSPGARVYWDKQHEDGVLLEDVNELTELWHFKTKPAWPVNGRDAVVLKTVYKSPSTIHVFSFSAEDPHLFPHIPPAELNVIRTQVDLQGWAIEALSPTTTLLTLLEQSDPKGWTNKTSIPTQMINTLAGIGEFAIKCGGPPFLTRLAGAKVNEIRYDHDRGIFKVEYEPCRQRKHTPNSAPTLPNPITIPLGQDENGLPSIECEIRCDIDTWGSSLDIVVDPPPQTITCLRRHRLSQEGGGLWLTLTHDSIFVDDERLLVLVRRAPGKDKGLVMVNGTKIHVDVEELSEHDIKSLTRQKRVKPPRIPLDQPPVMSVIRRKKAEWNGSSEAEEANKESTLNLSTTSLSSWASAPKISSPLARFFTYAMDQATTTTQQAVAAISPANTTGGMDLDPAKPPMYYVLQALAWTQEFYTKTPVSPSPSSTVSTQPDDGWTLVSDKGMTVQRKLVPEISPFIPVHKGSKIIEGISAGELATVINEFDCRKSWDERYGSARVLESYGGLTRSVFVTKKGSFPFRDRGFYLASVVALGGGSPDQVSPTESLSNSASGGAGSATSGVSNMQTGSAIYIVSASFSQPSSFDAAKYNSYSLPIGRVFMDAWILETLDPYNTKEKYAIPSSRCTRLVSVDYGGAVPAAFNAMINAGMARAVIGVETFIRGGGKNMAVPVMRSPPSGFQAYVEETKTKEGDAKPTGWTLKISGREDEKRILVDSKFDVEKKVYKSRVAVSLYVPSNKGARTKTRSSEGPRERREASNATIIAPRLRTSSQESRNAFSNHLLTPSHRERKISGDQASFRSTTSDSTLQAKSDKPSSDIIIDDDDADSIDDEHMSASTTTILAMPGAMMPGLKKAAFPGSTSGNMGVGLQTLNSTKDYISPSRALPTVRPIATSISGTGADHLSTSLTSSALVTPPRLRQRAASSGDTAPNWYSHSRSHSYSQSPTKRRQNQDPFAASFDGGGAGNNFSLDLSQRHQRGRTTSSSIYMGGSADTASSAAVEKEGGRGREREKLGIGKKGQGEVTLMELVVDSRMYPSGYKIDLRARKKDAFNVRHLSFDTVPLIGEVDTAFASPSSSVSLDADQSLLKLPFLTRIYTLPSSPLHSSSLVEGDTGKDCRAIRYLIRVLLHIGQDDEGNWDPLLVHERQNHPDKARQNDDGWISALEGAEIVVDLVVSPIGSIIQGKKVKVLVNGVEEQVFDEKESLSSLGRERLVDDQLASIGQLVRLPNEPDELPDQLKAPVGVANDLLVPPSPIASGSIDNTNTGSSSNDASLTITRAVSGEKLNGADGNRELSSGPNGEDSPSTPKLDMDRLASSHEITGRGILGFLQGYGYGNPLAQFTRGVSGFAAGDSRGGDELGALPHLRRPVRIGDGEDKSNSGHGKDEANMTVKDTTSATGAEGTTTITAVAALPAPVRGRYYHASTLLFVALIAFLMGSLLRSLLSPADFIYVVTDAEQAAVETGWREIRRLFEIKYLIGGWDFQVAVVRRHLIV